jgi:hypothetical protein
MDLQHAFTALADPVTRARVDSLLDDFRARAVPTTPLNIIAAATDAGLDSDAAATLAEAVEARLREREHGQ